MRVSSNEKNSEKNKLNKNCSIKQLAKNSARVRTTPLQESTDYKNPKLQLNNKHYTPKSQKGSMTDLLHPQINRTAKSSAKGSKNPKFSQLSNQKQNVLSQKQRAKSNLQDLQKKNCLRQIFPDENKLMKLLSIDFKAKPNNNQIRYTNGSTNAFLFSDQKNCETNQIQNQTNFLNHIDHYVDKLKNNLDWNKTKVIRTNQKDQRLNKLYKKIQCSEKVIFQLQIRNQMLEKQTKKRSKKQRLLMEKIHQTMDHARLLNSQLDKQKRERRKLERFFQDFQFKVREFLPRNQPNHIDKNWLMDSFISSFQQFQASSSINSATEQSQSMLQIPIFNNSNKNQKSLSKRNANQSQNNLRQNVSILKI